MSYSQRLLQQGSSLTRLAHRSRYDAVLSLLQGNQFQRALDYGCGDGWLLRSAYEAGLVTSGVGVDIAPQMLSLCEETLANIPGFQFCLPDAIASWIEPQSCDLLLCTETLEHVDSPKEILDTILSYCKPGATVVISVPIEIGPALLVKQFGRYLANFKGHYGYEKYTPKELWDAAFLWNTDSFPSSHSLPFTGFRAHKGFDYRKIKAMLAERLSLEKQVCTPFPLLGNWFNSTVFWVGRV
ncbi:class I SAM-dependent methyltransferase [Desertifilum sp. FACHB-1129]|uniref:Methyltransferase domain-containing protein n=2 Tax=Desertifilum tharense IPPAS B-1220 TaxID=1781255 RepID=A0A1E5QMP1_9CYAN|nr:MULTISPECIES: class I SAM-dependent methyltransferase [Desertifilum]MCD8487461.1 class I SAM-dependent methyltransferase [Desertifilum sp.]MDA0208799.1 class I SAM-dependent methyltransferase [Cyanobacteria bacterium FC1]MBD2311001.1 class I SAM-dependent methyltransferase [Desertifilum sp. FACHB-1129]MBD2321406.1 class I SAM-dependent methyltransferase [Desertifilum sp. FACHB-866]MBD2331287.1 class I SAM-dependent methyltransferase [Desertifilum sp. FACHB-868]